MTSVTSHESVIRLVRLRQGVGVRELARRMNVTPAAVTQWEASDRDGRMRELTRANVLKALGTTPEEEQTLITLEPLSRREERVTLELHRAVAKKLVDNPAEVLERARKNIPELRASVRGELMHRYVDMWEQLLYPQNFGELIQVLLRSDSLAIDMRQSSPFAGILTEPQRLEAIHRASREA